MSRGGSDAGFADHFSAQADRYQRYRPHYPPALFGWLAEQVPARRLAWDCASGNGQAARGLSRYFERVIATDASTRQVVLAPVHRRIRYAVCRAEQACLAPASVDLVTVAQAAHWLDHHAFYDEVRRVSTAEGILAVWAYGLLRTGGAVDALIRQFYTEVLGPYWPAQRRFIDEAYATLPFPFDELVVPPFAMSARWDVDQLLGYLGSWSAAQRYALGTQRDPLAALAADLFELWGAREARRTITWPLYVRVGRVTT